MKKNNILISLFLFASITYIFSSIYLGRMGYGFYLFKQKLPYSLNVSNDPFMKFHIEEEGIINTLKIGDSIIIEPNSNSYVIKSINQYSFNFSTNFLAFEIADARDSIIRVQFSIVKEMKNGTRIRYKLLNNDLDLLKWTDVKINKYLLGFLQVVLSLSILSMIILLYFIVKMRIKKRI